MRAHDGLSLATIQERMYMDGVRDPAVVVTDNSESMKTKKNRPQPKPGAVKVRIREFKEFTNSNGKGQEVLADASQPRP